MNKLKLIGNGFDLAHGLKTSYNYFMVWYLKKCLNTIETDQHSDALMDVEVDRPEHRLVYTNKISIGDLVEHCYKTNQIVKLLSRTEIRFLASWLIRCFLRTRNSNG